MIKVQPDKTLGTLSISEKYFCCFSEHTKMRNHISIDQKLVSL